MSHLLRNKFLFSLSRILVFFVILLLCWFLLVPPSQAPPARIVYIKKGTPLKKVSEILEQEGVIRNKRFFTLLATILNKKRKIKAGEYEFNTPMRPLAVLDALANGRVKLHLVTVPEGYSLFQIAQLFEDSNLIEKKEFFQTVTSRGLIDKLGLSQSAGYTLEGYLFPDTYNITRDMDPEEVVRKMVLQFKNAYDPDIERRASEIGFSEKETVILASIIEKETGLSEERPLISAVFHNRLKKHIPLQSDPTVIYGIKNFNGNLTQEDLMRPTPYNTYVVPGLPPTPICNPGKDSLLAAVSPASVPYLYFVSKNNGSHYFSADLKEHNQAVLKYQKSLIKKRP